MWHQNKEELSINGTDIAQICLNGHLGNPYVNTAPHRNKKFCPQCGEPEIMACPGCQTPLRGKGHDMSSALATYHVPAYCEGCGVAFPWTQRAIMAAKEFAELELTDEQDKEVFMQNVEVVTNDTPQTKVAATKIFRILAKLSGPAKDTLQELIVNIASETAKKIILGH